MSKDILSNIFNSLSKLMLNTTSELGSSGAGSGSVLEEGGTDEVNINGDPGNGIDKVAVKNGSREIVTKTKDLDDRQSINTGASEASAMGRLQSESNSVNGDTKNDENHKANHPSFSYDSEIFNLCQHYISTTNHQGLALIARQKGLPPFLRFKIWPILLKHHPFVVNPFIQPDEDTNSEKTPDINDEELKQEVKKDLLKYIHRLNYTNLINLNNASETEKEIFEILEHAILKFVRKWGKIIKYDQALTWIALGLAEWFPPIPNTYHVLVGRDTTNPENTCIKNLFDDYSNYIGNIPELGDYLEGLINDNEINNMSFRDVYERLVLVLLHAPEEKIRNKGNQPTTINKKILPINGGTIEERVSFFIYCFRKLLPELSQYFQEEQILNKFGSHDDEWLIWWLKWCGSKVWSRLDRGRIWDLIFGWRLQNSKKTNSYYLEKLNMNQSLIDKLGPDIFWSVSDDKSDLSTKDYKKSSSFKDLINELNSSESSNSNSPNSNSPLDSLINNTITQTRLHSSSSSNIASSNELNAPFSKLDPHIELLFVTLALLKSKENTLMELDQHEIRQFLSRLPTKSLNINNKYKKLNNQESEIDNNKNSNNNIVSNDSSNNHKIDFMDNIINEAGELWRKWLWLEMIDDN